MEKLKNIVKTHKVWSGIIILIVLLGGYFLYPKAKTQASYATAAAAKDTLIVSISASGQVSGANQVSITPLSSGLVTAVRAQSGQNVKAGQTIAVVDERSALISLTQAQASVASAQANYDKLLAGATSQDVSSTKLSLDSAQNSLNNSYGNALNSINQDYMNAENALKFQMNSLILNGETTFPQLTFDPSDPIIKMNVLSQRVSAGKELDTWSSELDALSASSAGVDIEAEIPKSNAHLAVIQNFFNTLTDALLAQNNLSSTALNTDESTVNSARSTIRTALNDLNSLSQNIASAKISLSQAQNAYDLKVAPPTPEDIQISKSQLVSAQAQLQSAQNTYQNNIISAPFDGQIGSVNVQKGDQISAATVIATLVTPNKIAELSLNEVDAANVHPGQKATMTFDAVSNLTISGKVAEVQNIGTVTQGVVNYGVKISMDTQDPRVLSGMSVTANIITAIKQDALLVPNSAVKTQGGQTYVEVLSASSTQPSPTNAALLISNILPEQVPVQTGLSNDTYTEILGGLNEGDMVVTQTVNSSVQTSSASSASGLRIPGITTGAGGGGGVRSAGGGALLGR